MKTLEKKFTYKEFEYSQILRDGNFAIYRQKLKDGGKSETFEVIIIDSHNGYEIAGQKIPPSEMYPSTNQWGVKGFTVLSYDDALKKLETLKKEEKNKKGKK